MVKIKCILNNNYELSQALLLLLQAIRLNIISFLLQFSCQLLYPVKYKTPKGCSPYALLFTTKYRQTASVNMYITLIIWVCFMYDICTIKLFRDNIGPFLSIL